MPKELIVSVAPQETKAAILENGEVVELHVERERDKGIVGRICKGRVTKVLPGMQSAFVDIGLDRDAFLYVSDFFEGTEEYDKIVNSAEEETTKPPIASRKTTQDAPISKPATTPPRSQEQRTRTRRLKRPPRFRGRRGPDQSNQSSQSLDQSKQSSRLSPTSLNTSSDIPKTSPSSDIPKTIPLKDKSVSVLPGESLAKYQTISEESVSSSPNLSEKTKETSFNKTNESANKDLKESLSDSKDVPTASAKNVLANEPAANEGKTVPNSLSDSNDALTSSEENVLVDQSTLPSSKTETVDKKLLPKTDKQSSSLSESKHQDDSSIQKSEVESSKEQGGSPKTPSGSTNKYKSSRIQHRSRPSIAKFFRRSFGRKRQNNNDDSKNQKANSSVPMISDILKEGEEILVQIAKEPLGTKGARITSHIALPGRYLVYMPTTGHIGVSRKIGSEEERQRLKRIILENQENSSGGFIVRTAGDSASEDEIKSDIKFLKALWKEIKKQSDNESAPAIIHRDLNLVQRILRDQLTKDFTNIFVDSESEYVSIVELINQFQPSLVKRVKLHTKNTPIFEEFEIQTEIDRAIRSKVWLKSGGYIVIDQAEALVAIDVNTGKYVGKSNKLEDTIVKTNIEAAREIARQLQLRDLGGIIVCDFIDMEDRKNRYKVTHTLEEALKRDRSPSKILQFNEFGLVAITRKRVKQSLLKILCEPCPECSGSGMVKSAQTICYEIQSETRKMATTIEGKEINLRVNPEVAKALKSEESSVILELESSLDKEIVVKSDAALSQEHFDIF